MQPISFLFWATIIVGILSFWWQSDKVKALALSHIYHYCKNQNLQLLDQTMVLKGVWMERDEEGSLGIRRRYTFEFTSTGEMRNHGKVEIFGQRLVNLELEPHILPDEEESVH